jgi:hypothetical protein
MDRAIGLPHGQQWVCGIRLHRRMLEKHLLLKFDPQGSLAGLAVRHAPEELSDLCAQLSENVLAAG